MLAVIWVKERGTPRSQAKDLKALLPLVTFQSPSQVVNRIETLSLSGKTSHSLSSSSVPIPTERHPGLWCSPYSLPLTPNIHNRASMIWKCSSTALPPPVTDWKNQFACGCFLIKVALHKNRFRNLSNSKLLENEDEGKKSGSGENPRRRKWIYVRNDFPVSPPIHHSFQTSASGTTAGW